MGSAVRPFLIIQNYMSSKKKTYGVRGLMEWQALIKCGKATVCVPFTGGTLTGYGVTPAEYTTENPVMQAIIEGSNYYKNGRIILMRETEGSGKFKEYVKVEKYPTHKAGAAATVANIQELVEPKPETAAKAESATEEAEESAADDSEADAAEANMTEDGKVIVDVTDWDDARDYLAEEFGVARRSIRSQVQTLQCAAEHNVSFRGLD